MTKDKKRVGIFSLTCDEGCSIYMIEVFNKKLLPWLERMEIVHFMSVSDKREFKDLDIALIEGTVSSERDKREVEEIREKSKILIAMGNCAITALPSGQRNNFDAEKKAEIQSDLDTYDFLPKCLALDEVVKVDDEIIGCPIDEKKFVEVFEKYL
jgi:coenzyme F420-reducing hydrogenase gamma subunit